MHISRINVWTIGYYPLHAKMEILHKSKRSRKTHKRRAIQNPQVWYLASVHPTFMYWHCHEFSLKGRYCRHFRGHRRHLPGLSIPASKSFAIPTRSEGLSYLWKHFWYSRETPVVNVWPMVTGVQWVDLSLQKLWQLYWYAKYLDRFANPLSSRAWYAHHSCERSWDCAGLVRKEVGYLLGEVSRLVLSGS